MLTLTNQSKTLIPEIDLVARSISERWLHVQDLEQSIRDGTLADELLRLSRLVLRRSLFSACNLQHG